ncbi:hypothetical protein Mpop_2741 [Methylorubrum populi BJ001]|uniref:Uncharacterized protein n=1 Tax=Methylorubrum populi (strain ATCC BAA-705 / NCIMB 13946 / BJ001) TaxID=441620 RepID=B1ZD27_METPB|nr:hypothetical protein [Methylorubrum populi]ACB80896.1 hypothetical protein Mpop_2741 [Methylorubrum populi BJ001]
MRLLLSFITYLGVGAFCHALMVGSEFQPTNVLSWAWLIGWPVAVVIAQLAVFFAVVAVVMLAVLCIAAIEAARS